MYPLDRILKIQAVAYIIIFALAVPYSVNAQNWSLTGNAGTNPANNFLGTQDNQPLVIKTNDVEAIHINPGILGPPTNGHVLIPGSVSILGCVGFGATS